MSRAIVWAGPLIGLGLAGCGGPEDPSPVRFPTPWAQAQATEQVVAGGFTAELGSDLPGAGWFESGVGSGMDASRARIVDRGASWPVVQLEIFGFGDSGWDRLELSIAQNHLVAGDIPVDGEACVGRLALADGSTRYLVGGSVHISRPGLVDGEVLSGWFSDVVLSEVAR